MNKVRGNTKWTWYYRYRVQFHNRTLQAQVRAAAMVPSQSFMPCSAWLRRFFRDNHKNVITRKNLVRSTLRTVHDDTDEHPPRMIPLAFKLSSVGRLLKKFFNLSMIFNFFTFISDVSISSTDFFFLCVKIAEEGGLSKGLGSWPSGRPLAERVLTRSLAMRGERGRSGLQGSTGKTFIGDNSSFRGSRASVCTMQFTQSWLVALLSSWIRTCEPSAAEICEPRNQLRFSYDRKIKISDLKYVFPMRFFFGPLYSWTGKINKHLRTLLESKRRLQETFNKTTVILT